MASRYNREIVHYFEAVSGEDPGQSGQQLRWTDIWYETVEVVDKNKNK